MYEILNSIVNETKINSTEYIFLKIHNGGVLFSLFSIVCCIALLLLLLFNKTLRSLTYNFLSRVFISEIIGNIGHLLEIFKFSKDKNISKGWYTKVPYFLIPFSDIYTMLLFCFFSYCSIELIKKSNINIKTKERLFFIISLLVAFIYVIIIFFLLPWLNYKRRFYFYGEFIENVYVIFIHIGILACMTGYIFYNTFIVIQFMKEKQKSDKINSWKIAKLIKFLFRFPLICLLYWIFYIISLPLSIHHELKDNVAGIEYDEKYKIAFIFILFSNSFFNLRGFLIFLNTIKTNKVEILIKRIIEVNIKHNLLLKFDIFSKKGKEIKDTDKKKDDEEGI